MITNCELLQALTASEEFGVYEQTLLSLCSRFTYSCISKPSKPSTTNTYLELIHKLHRYKEVSWYDENDGMSYRRVRHMYAVLNGEYMVVIFDKDVEDRMTLDTFSEMIKLYNDRIVQID